MIVTVVALEQDDLAVALKGKYVGGDAIQEPAIVGYHHDAAGEGQQGLFQGAQGFDIEVIGGFVQ